MKAAKAYAAPLANEPINPQRNAAVSASLNRFLRQVLLAEPGLLTWHVSLGCDRMERMAQGAPYGAHGINGRLESKVGSSKKPDWLLEETPKCPNH